MLLANISYYSAAATFNTYTLTTYALYKLGYFEPRLHNLKCFYVVFTLSANGNGLQL